MCRLISNSTGSVNPGVVLNVQTRWFMSFETRSHFESIIVREKRENESTSDVLSAAGVFSVC